MPANLRERTTNWSGGMNDSATSADDFAPNQASLLYNCRVELDNTVGCVAGSRLLGESPASATTYGRGIVEFVPNSGTRELVKFTSNGTNTTVVYSTDSGVTWSAVATLNAIDGDWSLATMNKGGTNYLLGAVGAASCYKYSGGGAAGWAAWAAVPVANVKYIAVHNERCWAATGTTSTVYASKIADFETWADPDGLTLPVQTHDGDRITGIAQAGGILLVFKRHSTSYVDGFGASDVVVAAGTRGISGGNAGVGCIAPRSFQAVGNGWVWLSERGLEHFDGQAITPTAAGAYEYIQTIARNRITEATGTGSAPTLPCSVYWPERQEYWIAWPSSTYASTATTAVNDEGLILNLRTGAVSRRVWNPTANSGSFKLHPASMCLAEVTVDDESYVRPVVLTKYGDVLAMDLGVNEMEGPGVALPSLTSDVLVLEAGREAWSRGLSAGDTLSLDGLTITDLSPEGNDCTGAGGVSLVHDGTEWVFRFDGTDGHIVLPAIDLTGTSGVTAGVRLVAGDATGTILANPKAGTATVATGFDIAQTTTVNVTVPSAVLQLDAALEAARRGMITTDTLALDSLTITDDSGSGNDCVCSGTVSLVYDSGWVFRFTNGILTSPSVDLTGTQAVTVGVRVKTTQTTAERLLSAASTVAGTTDGLYLDHSTLVVALHRTETGAAAQFIATYGTGTKSLVTVYDKSQAAADEIKIYLDGVDSTAVSVTNESTNAFGNYPLRIGRVSTGTSPFVGDIARLTVHSSALAGADLTSLNTYLDSGIVETTVVTVTAKGDAGTNSAKTASITGDKTSVIAVVDKTQAAANEIKLYVAGSLSTTAISMAANNTNAFGNTDSWMGGTSPGSGYFSGDIARITLQATALAAGAELTALNTYLDDGSAAATTYDIDARLRTRTYDFGEPDEQKWARRVDVTAMESDDQTVTLYPITDGTTGTSQSLTFGTAAGDEPLTETARISERGLNHQVELRFSGGMKISAVRMEAQLLTGTLR